MSQMTLRKRKEIPPPTPWKSHWKGQMLSGARWPLGQGQSYIRILSLQLTEQGILLLLPCVHSPCVSILSYPKKERLSRNTKYGQPLLPPGNLTLWFLRSGKNEIVVWRREGRIKVTVARRKHAKDLCLPWLPSPRICPVPNGPLTS